MKRKRTMTSMGLCLAMVLGLLAGCKAPSVNPSYTPSPAATQTPAATPSPVATPSPTADPDRPPIGLYLPEAGSSKRVLVSTFTGPWEQGKDIDCFEAIASQQPSLSGGSFRRLWQAQWALYPKADTYRIGYTLAFTLASGEVVQQTILGPADVTDAYTPYIEVYLYDDIHQQAGVRYSHLLESEMDEQTVITSIKLTAGEQIEQVQRIELTAFVYRDSTEFDADTGAYTGPGGYTIAIENE